ncbi:hypothetical protein B0T20DRAFT_481027 [Sordaria brevicollis]|uniref:Uncharacterized protein n=1 Tax=Sordaria brevicollis TaxID=83679 RepID=A0AAE0U9L2_SORBR|nr:hypothetical protein B0T20DRAFT_481027 [Sordaria brevicollis]
MSRTNIISTKGRANIGEDGSLSEQHGSRTIQDSGYAIHHSPRHSLLSAGPSNRETKSITPVLGPTLPNGQPRRRRRALAGPLPVPLAPRRPQHEINHMDVNSPTDKTAHDKPDESLKGYATTSVVPVDVMAVSAEFKEKTPKLPQSQITKDQNGESLGMIRAVDSERVQEDPNDQRLPNSPSPEANATNRPVPVQATTIRARTTTIRARTTTIRARTTTIRARTTTIRARATTIRARATTIRARVMPIRARAPSRQANATNSVVPVPATITTTSTMSKEKKSMLHSEVIKNLFLRQDREMTIIMNGLHTTRYARMFHDMVQGVHNKTSQSQENPTEQRTTTPEEAHSATSEESTESGTDAVDDNDGTNNNSPSNSEFPDNSNNETKPPSSSTNNPPDTNQPSTKWSNLLSNILNASTTTITSAINYIRASWPSPEKRKREEQWAEATRMWQEDVTRRADRVMREIENREHIADYCPLVPISPPQEVGSYESYWVRKMYHEGWGWWSERGW